MSPPVRAAHRSARTLHLAAVVDGGLPYGAEGCAELALLAERGGLDFVTVECGGAGAPDAVALAAEVAAATDRLGVLPVVAVRGPEPVRVPGASGAVPGAPAVSAEARAGAGEGPAVYPGGGAEEGPAADPGAGCEPRWEADSGVRPGAGPARAIVTLDRASQGRAGWAVGYARPGLAGAGGAGSTGTAPAVRAVKAATAGQAGQAGQAMKAAPAVKAAATAFEAGQAGQTGQTVKAATAFEAGQTVEAGRAVVAVAAEAATSAVERAVEAAVGAVAREWDACVAAAGTRPPQGRPVIAVNVGGVPAVRAVAARHADLAFVRAAGPEAAGRERDELRGLAAASGRDPDRLLVLAELSIDLSGGELGQEPGAEVGPVPDGSGGLIFRGGPVDLAELIARWRESGAVDGFLVRPAEPRRDLERFVNGTVALLQHRGLFRTFHPGATLREHLDLHRPVPPPRPPGARPATRPNTRPTGPGPAAEPLTASGGAPT